MVPRNRVVVLVLLVLSIAILIPGLFQPVLIIRGVLTREGVAEVAPGGVPGLRRTVARRSGRISWALLVAQA